MQSICMRLLLFFWLESTYYNLKISEWVRPLGMKKRGARKFWVPEEDSYIQTHTLEESCSKLGRSEKSIKMRLFRLEHGLDYGHKPVLNIKAIDTKGASK